MTLCTRDFGSFAIATIFSYSPCATIVSLSTESSPVLFPYGSLSHLPSVCSVRVSEALALSGTIVYRLFTSHHSLSIITCTTISIGFSGLSTDNNILIASSRSSAFHQEITLITLS